LETVPSQVDAAIEQRLINLLGEESLATDLRQRRVQNLVASGFDGDEFHHEARPAFLEFRFRPVRLPQSECAAAGTEFHLSDGWARSGGCALSRLRFASGLHSQPLMVV